MNILSILFRLTSNSFIIIWFSMEIRIFRFIIVLFLHQHNLRNSHVVKYFMFQAFSSVALVISLCKGLLFHDVLLLVAMIKLGAAPFHLWFIRIVEKLRITHFFWIAVPQKIIPFRLIQVISLPSSSFNKILLLRLLLASIHIIIQFKFMKILAASSIYITPWILFCFFTSDLISWLFFITYSAIQALALTFFFTLKVKADPLSYKRSNVTYFLMMLLIIIMAGFPPRPLFFIKLRILFYLFRANLALSALLLMLIARIVIFNYLNVISLGVLISVRNRRIGL